MFKLTLRSLLARKARTVLTAFSVMVGVAFVSGAFILTDSFEKSFDGLFKELNAGVDFRVRGAVEFGDAASGDPVPAAPAPYGDPSNNVRCLVREDAGLDSNQQPVHS